MIKAISAILLAVLAGFFVAVSDEHIIKDNAQNLVVNEKAKDIIIFAVGDIMLDRGVKYMIEKYGNNDYILPFVKIKDKLKEADLVFGNLESQISDKGHNVGSIYSFRARPEALAGLAYAGFDIVSVANNHSFDYTRLAFEDSLKKLKGAGIEYVGGGFSKEEAFSLKVIEREGVKIGFLAYTSVGSLSWKDSVAVVEEADLEEIKEKVRDSKEKVDVLIVSFHSGDEYEIQPNEFQKMTYKSLIDSGADLIIGHHPHVVQPVIGYSSGWIAYSLGNFIFDQYFSSDTMKGMMLKAVISEKKIKDVDFYEIKINEYYQAELGE